MKVFNITGCATFVALVTITKTNFILAYWVRNGEKQQACCRKKSPVLKGKQLTVKT